MIWHVVHGSIFNKPSFDDLSRYFVDFQLVGKQGKLLEIAKTRFPCRCRRSDSSTRGLIWRHVSQTVKQFGLAWSKLLQTSIQGMMVDSAEPDFSRKVYLDICKMTYLSWISFFERFFKPIFLRKHGFQYFPKRSKSYDAGNFFIYILDVHFCIYWILV